jgi:cytoskeletal protein RodZ
MRSESMQRYEMPVAAGLLAALLALAGAALVQVRDAAAQDAATPATKATPPAAAPATASPAPPAAKAPTSADASGDRESAAQAGEQEGSPASAPAKPTTAGKGSPQRFEPSEKVRPDFDVAFPVDI